MEVNNAALTKEIDSSIGKEAAVPIFTASQSMTIVWSYYILVLKLTVFVLVRVYLTVSLEIEVHGWAIRSFSLQIMMLVLYFSCVCCIAIYSYNWSDFKNNLLSGILFLTELYFYFNTDFGVTAVAAAVLCMSFSAFCMFSELFKVFNNGNQKMMALLVIYVVGLSTVVWDIDTNPEEKAPTYFGFNKIFGTLVFNAWCVLYLRDPENVNKVSIYNFSCFFLIDSLVVLEYVFRNFWTEVSFMIYDGDIDE